MHSFLCRGTCVYIRVLAVVVLLLPVFSCLCVCVCVCVFVCLCACVCACVCVRVLVRFASPVWGLVYMNSVNRLVGFPCTELLGGSAASPSYLS